MASLPKADDAFTQTRLMPTFRVSAERPAEGLKVRVHGFDRLEWTSSGYASLTRRRAGGGLRTHRAAVVGSKALCVLQRSNSLSRLRSTRTSAF